VPKVDLKSGVRIHYQQIGEGPDLVMIHGLTGNLAVWHLKIIPMISHRFRTLTYDLRGHGYSDLTPGGYSADAMANDLLGLLDALEIERPALVGHSYGADIALYFALNHPERVSEVVAIEAALPAMIHIRSRDDWEGWDYWAYVLEKAGHVVPPERRSDVDYLLRASLGMPKKWGPLNGLPRNPKPFLRLIDETSVAADYEAIGTLTLEKIPAITTPVLLMYTAGSAFLATHDYLNEHLPNATSLILPRTEWGHFGPLEQPELVAEHIVAALGQRELAVEVVGE
jgi:pimeloyl-ACP methyl ester carboxylesterase